MADGLPVVTPIPVGSINERTVKPPLPTVWIVLIGPKGSGISAHNTMDGHRICYCGHYAELVGSMHTKECYVHCPNCGARAVTQRTPFRAWLAWDNEQLQDDENYTLYELLK